MDFILYEDKKSRVKTATNVHIGPCTISIEKHSWDKTFESEHTIKAISIGKMLEATGVADIEALRPRPIKNVKGWGRRCASDFVLQARERSELRD